MAESNSGGGGSRIGLVIAGIILAAIFFGWQLFGPKEEPAAPADPAAVEAPAQ